MAVNLHPGLKYRSEPPRAQSKYFRRKDKLAKTKKIQRKIKLKHVHVLVCFILIVGFFVAFQQTYMFLISWDRLNVEHIIVICNKFELQAAGEQFFEGKRLGNILLVDINRLRRAMEINSWVKEVHIKKVLPSSIKVEIFERIPIAMLQQDSLFLIDREGERLTALKTTQDWDVPLLVDKNYFKTELMEKINLAWSFLDDLPANEKNAVKVIDLSEYANVKAKLEDCTAWLKLGDDQYANKIKAFRSERKTMERFGPLEYVDLRVQDRIVFKVQKRSGKETL